jgi:hypothetical protein
MVTVLRERLVEALDTLIAVLEKEGNDSHHRPRKHHQSYMGSHRRRKREGECAPCFFAIYIFAFSISASIALTGTAHKWLAITSKVKIMSCL